jgi:hypothetical protein
VAGTSFNPASASPIQWANAPIKDASVFTHSTSSSNHQITVLIGGDYLVYFNSLLASGSNRTNSVMRIAVNGTALSGGHTSSFYVRNTGGHNESSGTLVYHLRRLNANDIITVTSEREAGTGAVTSPGTALTIIHKP